MNLRCSLLLHRFEVLVPGLFHLVLTWSLLAFPASPVQDATPAPAERARADGLDSLVTRQMVRREIVGLSLAIIDSGRIVEARAWGTTTRGGAERVTPATLFQAGSISKPVAALAALQLVEQGRLTLDEDVNDRLTSWKVPQNEFTRTQKVTLRRLLSHTAGLTVHGFPGYAITQRVPTPLEVLDGKGNTPPVRVDVEPGSIWRYSGGGYTVMQQLVEDMTGMPFHTVLQQKVLGPLGMTSSTYEQPLPQAWQSRTASGYRTDRRAVNGRWHVYPEMAAAGLWTTPSDLARYAIGVQQMLAGRSRVLSATMARQMLTEQKGGYGLGPGVADTGATLRFSHGGRDEGFDAFLVAYAHSGRGVVIMINGNDNSRAVNRVVNFVARTRGWPNYETPVPEAVIPTVMSASALDSVAGRYEVANNNMLTLFAREGRLHTDVNGLGDEEWVPAADGRFVSTDRVAAFRVVRNAQGAITGIDMRTGNTPRTAPRIGPLFTVSPPAGVDRALAARLDSARHHFVIGGDMVRQSPLLTEGARTVFLRPTPQLGDATAMVLVAAEDVSGRGIVRHGHAVARVMHYRVQTPGGERLLLMHLDSERRVADIDIVAR